MRWKLNAITLVNNNSSGNQSKHGFDRMYGGQQDLRPLELAGRMLAAAQQRPELGVFFLAQFDPVPYIHSDLLEGETRRIQR